MRPPVLCLTLLAVVELMRKPSPYGDPRVNAISLSIAGVGVSKYENSGMALPSPRHVGFEAMGDRGCGRVAAWVAGEVFRWQGLLGQRVRKA